MALAMFAAGAGGIQRANAAGIADQTGSAGESETIQQSEETKQSEALPLKNVKKAPKLSGKWVKQHGKVRFLLPDKTYAAKTWANIKGKYYYFEYSGLENKKSASGYQLVTVSELAKYRGVSMYSGGVYNAFYR